MTDVITITDTLAVADPVTETVEVGYIAQTVSSSGGTLASTVTDETAYGVAKAVGTSASSAREDHTHGSPALGVTGTTAAAGNHAHAGVYDVAGTATSAVSSHVAAADPHGDRSFSIQRANHTGSQLAATISDFATTVATTAVLKATATTKGDLLAATGNATIARLGAGADGQVLVADSSQAAGLKYSDLRPYVRSARITSGDINLPNTASAWAVLLDTTTAIVGITIPAVVGEWVQVHVHGMRSQTASRFLDVAVVTGGAPTIQRYLSSGTATPSVEGDPGWYPAAAFQLSNGPRGFTVASGDLDTGNVRFAVVIKTTGATGTLYASASYPLYLQAENKRVVL